MKKRMLLLIALSLFYSSFIYAQEKTDEGCNLEMIQERIKNEVKEELKDNIKTINKKLDEREITQDKAEKQKKKIAEQKAKNIGERQEIARLFFQYAQRNNMDNICEIELPVRKEDYEEWVCHIENKESENKGWPFDWPQLTNSGEEYSVVHSRLILGFGFNNTFTEDDFLSNNNYDNFSSRYFEIGWEWSRRILKEANWFRFNYGLSFQFNGFKQDNDFIFVENGKQTELQDSGRDLDKSKFRMTNIIIPLHIELNNSMKVKKPDTAKRRTFTQPDFKFGFGGFLGINTANMQKLKYEQNGNDFKLKEKGDFNVERFLFGLSTYVGFDDVQLFGQYNLNPVFSDNSTNEHNFQIGIRLELGE